MAQNAVRQPGTNRRHPATDAAQLRTYRAELSADMLDPQGELLDWVIAYAFETLHATRLTLRVTPGTGAPGRRAGVL